MADIPSSCSKKLRICSEITSSVSIPSTYCSSGIKLIGAKYSLSRSVYFLQSTCSYGFSISFSSILIYGYILYSSWIEISSSIKDFSSSAFSAFFCFNINSMRSFSDKNLLVFDTFFRREVNLFFTICSVRVDFINLDMQDHFFPSDFTNLSSSISY